MFSMKNTSPQARAGLEKNFERLRQKLARIGYISRGSVLARSVVTSGRSGYQWTRKVAGKTVTVALTAEQFSDMGLCARPIGKSPPHCRPARR